MEKITLPSSTASPLFSPLSITKLTAARTVSFSPSRPRKFVVAASKDDPMKKLTEADLMEFKFGQMLGEDPKLTVAKIMGRKLNPDASYLEIEKNFYKNKGKLVEVKEVPFDMSDMRGTPNPKTELNLMRPVPKKGIKIGGTDDSGSLETKPRRRVSTASKSNVPNIILRKPSVYNEADDVMAESLKLRIKPNLSLKMRNDPVKEKFEGMTLLKRPEPASIDQDTAKESQLSPSIDSRGSTAGVEEISRPKRNSVPNNETYPVRSNKLEDASVNRMDRSFENQGHGQQLNESYGKLTILEKPKPAVENNSVERSSSEGISTMENFVSESCDASGTEAQPDEPNDVEPSVDKYEDELHSSSSAVEVALKGKPRRLDQPIKPQSSDSSLTDLARHEPHTVGEVEWMNSPQTSPLEEHEDSDWERAEKLSTIGYRVDVELISCSTRGFAVSFGSLIGFLPYRKLTDKFKFFAFPSWLRKKGLDPAKYRQNLGIVGSYEFLSNNSPLDSSNSESGRTAELVTADMGLEDLLRIYDQEKINFLSSFVGQRIKVFVSLADKKFRRLTFSLKPKEKLEMVEKRRNLMARLSIGDVVKCSITKITYFGIFVEVEGVPALIHQTEVSWDGTLDPLDFKIGQILEAKVNELDYPLERISLSLKDITPDPMNEALECVVGDSSALTERYESSSQADAEWAEADSLIKELESIDGVQSISKGRFFLSPSLAPTFQVYMASVFEKQYKLLARSGNKGQEVIVESSLGKEEMKTAILTCTNRMA